MQYSIKYICAQCKEIKEALINVFPINENWYKDFVCDKCHYQMKLDNTFGDNQY